MKTRSALPSARLASLNARSLTASTPNVSHSMSVLFCARHGAVTSPPGPVVAAALCTACAMMVKRSAARAGAVANGPAASAASAPDNVFRVSLRVVTRSSFGRRGGIEWPPSPGFDLAPAPDRDRRSCENFLALDHVVARGRDVRLHLRDRALGLAPADRRGDREVLVVNATRTLARILGAERRA